MKTISILQYQGSELLGTTVCSFDSAGKKKSEILSPLIGTFSTTTSEFIYNEDGLLIESREYNSSMRSRTFFHYQDTLKISSEEFSEFYFDKNNDSIKGFFSMKENEIPDSVFPVKTDYVYNEGKLSLYETDGVSEGEAVRLGTAVFYNDNGKKRKEITNISEGLRTGIKTDEVDYEYSADGKTEIETHNSFSKNSDTYSIIYSFGKDGELLTKEFKDKNGIFQKHVYKYEYYN